MSHDKFQLPTIPALHIPQYTLVQDGGSQQPDRPIRTTTNTRTEDADPVVPVNNTTSTPPTDESAVTTLVTNFPKLCPACSNSLLQFLRPLQLYVNQLVTITSGMAEQCDHIHIINKMQELPEILNLSQVPPGRTRKPEEMEQGSVTEPSRPPDRQQPEQGTVRIQFQANDQRQEKRSDSAQPHVNHQETRGDRHRQDQGQRVSEYQYQRSETRSPSTTHQENGGSRSDSRPHASQYQQHQQQQWQQHQYNQAREQPQQQIGRNEEKRREDGGEEIRREQHEPQRQEHEARDQQRGESSQPAVPSPKFTRSTEGSPVQVQAVSSSSAGHVSDQGESPAPRSTNAQREDFEEVHENGGSPTTTTAAGQFDSGADSDSDQRPFSFVTIVYDNLSAVNAIILCNSLTLSCTKQVRHNGQLFRIPFVALITGHVDPILKDFLPTVFDEVFLESRDARLSLLMDESFGVSQVKMQLWKRLSGYEKCFFIESTCLVVGNLDDSFLQFHELSACVDWMFPDSFSCSVFVFEPRIETYNQLMRYATDIVQANEDPEVPPADDMTILNQFFSNKWIKMSFIYNYSQNTAIYTQQPAFARFGGSIKIVNFDFTPISGPGAFTRSTTGGQSTGPASQPWHVQFDLNRSAQVGEVMTHSPVNSYVQFYLNIFIKRVWPIVRSHLTPLLLARNKHDWSIYELVGLLRSPGQELDQSMPYSPIILRRRDPYQQYNTEEPVTAVVEPSEEPVVEDTSADDDDGDEEEGPLDEGHPEQEDEDAGETTATDTVAIAAVAEKPKLVPDLRSDRRVWESGNPDWIGAHGSDKLIDRLKDKFK